MFFQLSFTKCAVYEIMWQNIVQSDRSQMAVWRMCILCWITKATNTYTEYVILITSLGNNGCFNWSVSIYIYILTYIFRATYFRIHTHKFLSIYYIYIYIYHIYSTFIPTHPESIPGIICVF